MDERTDPPITSDDHPGDIHLVATDRPSDGDAGGQSEHPRLALTGRHGDDGAVLRGPGGHGQHTALCAGFDVALHGVADGREEAQGLDGGALQRRGDVDLDA